MSPLDQQLDDANSDAHRLALELECLLLDTKDLPVVSKWWESGMQALELHRQRLNEEMCKALNDAVVTGTGVMVGNRHIELAGIYATFEDDQNREDEAKINNRLGIA